MRRVLLTLAVAIAVILPAFTVGSVRQEASALSPYCYLDVTAPYASGVNNIGAGTVNCSYHTGTVTFQVCIYQGSVAKQCTSGNYLAPLTKGFGVGCARNPSAGTASFRTWVWVRDGKGNTEYLWSSIRTLQGCY